MKRNRLKDMLLIIFGSMIAAFGFHFFMAHINLVTGGVGGIGIILADLFSIDTSYIVLGLNIIFLVLGYVVLGKAFFLKTVFGSILYPVFIFIYERIDKFYNIGSLTDNILLNVFMSSLLVGAGIGLVIRSGGSTGGLDVPQVIMHKLLHLPFSVCIYIIDGVIVFFGMVAFGVELALFSTVGLILNGIVIDKTLFTNSKKVLNIITEKGDIIKEKIFQEIDRGVTEIDCVGSYSKENKKLLVCVIDAKEYQKTYKLIQELDGDAFVFINQATEVGGRGFSVEKDYKY